MAIYTAVSIDLPEGPQSVWTGVAVAENGDRVHFAGDWRCMRDLWEKLDAGDWDGDCEINLEPWQILGPAEQE